MLRHLGGSRKKSRWASKLNNIAVNDTTPTTKSASAVTPSPKIDSHTLIKYSAFYLQLSVPKSTFNIHLHYPGSRSILLLHSRTRIHAPCLTFQIVSGIPSLFAAVATSPSLNSTHSPSFHFPSCCLSSPNCINLPNTGYIGRDNNKQAIANKSLE